MQAVIFSPIQFLCNFVAGREVCPGASFGVPQQKGPSLSEPSGSGIFYVGDFLCNFSFLKYDQVTCELWWYFFFFLRGLTISSKLFNVWA